MYIIYIHIYVIAEQKQGKDTVIVKQSSYESCIILIAMHIQVLCRLAW